MEALKGDFIGFQYGDYHSSELGIMRVSNNSRYIENLSPDFTNKTVVKTGADGSIFFNSYYSQKSFPLLIAYDNVNEEQKRLIQQVFNNKIPQKLIFDETPYKYYIVKISSPSSLNFLPFSEKGERIYKGEGNIELVAFFPYARSVYKTLNEYTNLENTEWFKSSGLKNDLTGFDTFFSETGSINLYNPGDLEAYNILKIKFDDSQKINGTIFSLDGESKMELKEFFAVGEDEEIRINSYSHLIEGYKGEQRTGNIYNQYKIAGDFFNIPLGESKLEISNLDNNISIDYQYLYY